MFEKGVASAFKKVCLNHEMKKEFFILTHKKHHREIYFEKGNIEALKFVEVKFRSIKKRVFYFFLKLGILNPFIRKIFLPSNVGNLVFVGGQIKIFNFDRGEVISFPMPHETKEDFIEFKTAQQKLGNLGFAPIVFEINKKDSFSKEEFLQTLKTINPEKIFKKLLEYYKINKNGLSSSKKYLNLIQKNLLKNGIKDRFIFDALRKIKDKHKKLFFVTSHGDFSKEQVLEKNEKIIFTDSGGIQEEACILQVPCITLRTTTERPESIEVGANILMSDNLFEDFNKMLSVEKTWKNPFGKGNSGEEILLSLNSQNQIKNDY